MQMFFFNFLDTFSPETLRNKMYILLSVEMQCNNVYNIIILMLVVVRNVFKCNCFFKYYNIVFNPKFYHLSMIII